MNRVLLGLTVFAGVFVSGAVRAPAQIVAPTPPGPAAVQRPNRIGQPILRKMRRLSGVLGLSQGQKQEIVSIVKDTRARAREVRSDGSLPRKQRRAQVREWRRSMRAQVADVLTPEQKAKLQEIRRRRRPGAAPGL